MKLGRGFGKHMATFSANPGDLEDAVAYELDAIEFLRTSLYNQSEVPGGGASLTLGDLTEDGHQKRSVSVSVTMNVSGEAVRAALDRLRPLAFSAAFKMQDMIAEWILRANGATDWRFREKLRGYDRLRAAGTIVEPSLFAQRPVVAQAFWELYRFFVPYRGTVVHAGGVVLHQGGMIEITSRSGKAILFAAPQQGCYMRAMCIIAKALLGHIKFDPFMEALAEADLHNLENYHGQKGLRGGTVRVDALTVNVPPSHIIQQQPLSVSIDFNYLRRTMETGHAADCRVYFPVTIVVRTDERTAAWNLPIESVPNGVVALREGDAEFDRFLRIVLHNAGG